MSDLEALSERIGHRFRDPALLEASLVHASLAAELGDGRGNERLEFLGDAVLDLVVGELLYARNPDWDEGVLTRARAALIRKESLAEQARRLGLGEFVRLGRTELTAGGSEKDTILADCFEAVVGAVYLDAGLEPVRRLVEQAFGAEAQVAPPEDPKTRFQEWAHARFRETPRYATVGDSGVDDDETRFRVEVALRGRVWGTGVGRSKRVAERAAAREAVAAAQREAEHADG